jgi:hypothetical protein
MSSVRIDGGFWMDPRIVSGHAGDNAAAGVYSRLMSYCGKYNTDTVPAALVAVVAGEDHVKPLARGGSNWPANLRPACKSCNSRKGARWPFEQRPARRPM